MRYKVIHNGYDINWFNKESDVNKYIQSILEEHININPRKIMDRKLRVGNQQIRIIRYRYNTLYEEDFIIEHDC